MDGLGRAIGAPVPIQFNGETLLLDGVQIEDFGTVEQHLLAERPKPLEIARPESVAFIREAAALVPEISSLESQLARLDEQPTNVPEQLSRRKAVSDKLLSTMFVRDQLLGIAEKLLSDARRDACKKNYIPAKEVGAWLDSLEGLVFSVWMKLDQRYPQRFSLTETCRIIQAMTQQDRERLKSLRDQASGFDDLGNSTGPTSTETTMAGPTGG